MFRNTSIVLFLMLFFWGTAQNSLNLEVIDAYTGPSIYYLSFLPDSSQIALFSTSDDAVIVLDWVENKALLDETGGFDLALNFAVSPDGQYLVWDDFLSGIKFRALTVDAPTLDLIQASEDNSIFVSGMVFSPSSDIFAVAYSDTANEHVEVYRIVDGSPQKFYDLLNGPFESESGYWNLDFDVSGSYLAGADGKRIKIWDLLGQGDPFSLEKHSANIRALAMIPSETDTLPLVASGDETGTVWLWFNDREESFQAHDSPITALAYSLDGSKLVTAAEDKSIKIWDTASKQLLASFQHNQNVYAMDFSSDGKYLAVNAGEPDTEEIFTVYGTADKSSVFGTVSAGLPYDAEALMQDSSLPVIAQNPISATPASTPGTPQTDPKPSKPSKPTMGKTDQSGTQPGKSSTPTETQAPANSQPASSQPTLDITSLSANKARVSNIGVLEPGDDTLDDGSYMDVYTIELQAGQEIIATLLSADFDTYLSVISPDLQDFYETDEFPDEASRSRISLTIPTAGTWYVLVTSETTGESGNYLLSIKQ